MDTPLAKAVGALRALHLNETSIDVARMQDLRHADVINKASVDSLDAMRANLNPREHFIAYIAVLHASLANAKPTDVQTPILISTYCRFVSELGAQYARIVPHRWCGAGRHAARLAVEGRNVQQCLALIIPLREAADKITPTENHLVPLHVDFLTVCMEAKCYDRAARWAAHRRLLVDVEDTAIEASDVVLAYYYSGCVFIALKQFRNALDCFRISLAVPAQTGGSGRVHDLIAATYKKYVLMNLLVHGTAPRILKLSNFGPNRLRSVASDYLELCAVFAKFKVVELRNFVEAQKSTLERDGNYALVQQIVRALPREIIRRLTDSYVSMRIEDVARRAGLDSKNEAEKLLVQLISQGVIRGHIDSKEGVVRFVDKVDVGAEEGREVYEAPAALANMHQNMQRCLKGLRNIQLFKDSLLQDTQYLKKEHQSQRKGTQRTSLGFITNDDHEDAEMDTRDLDTDIVL